MNDDVKEEIQRSRWGSMKTHTVFSLPLLVSCGISLSVKAGRGINDKLPQDKEGTDCSVALWEVSPVEDVHQS